MGRRVKVESAGWDIRHTWPTRDQKETARYWKNKAELKNGYVDSHPLILSLIRIRSTRESYTPEAPRKLHPTVELSRRWTVSIVVTCTCEGTRFSHPDLALAYARCNCKFDLQRLLEGRRAACQPWRHEHCYALFTGDGHMTFCRRDARINCFQGPKRTNWWSALTVWSWY